MILSDAEQKSLTEEFQKGQKRIAEIAALGQALTQEALAEGQGLKARLVEIKGKIDDHNEGVTKGADLKTFASESHGFLNTPIRTMPVPDGSGSDDMTTPAGHSYVETDEKGVRRVIWEDGPGTFGKKTWDAISTKDYRKVMRKYITLGLNSLSLVERKLLEEGLDPQGGYTVPIDSLARLIQRLPTPTRVAGMVDSIDTSREYVEMMKVNYSADNIYTTGFRVTKTGEIPTGATQARVSDSSLFGVVRIPVHTFMITGVLTNNQVEDSALNVMQWMTDKFRETTDILWDDKILNGSSKGEATGILCNVDGSTDYVASVHTGDANLVLPDSLLNIQNDIPEQYDENCQYLFNKTNTFKAIRTLKDSQNRYLFGSGYQDSGLATPNRPKDLGGYPFAYSGLMPNIAANAYPVIFGDLRGYQLVRRIGFSVQVLRELYAEVNQVAIVGRLRFGGQPVQPWRMRALKVAV